LAEELVWRVLLTVESNILKNIPAAPKRDRILSRLGYRNGITELGSNV
jgi:hypothetical protein